MPRLERSQTIRGKIISVDPDTRRVVIVSSDGTKVTIDNSGAKRGKDKRNRLHRGVAEAIRALMPTAARVFSPLDGSESDQSPFYVAYATTSPRYDVSDPREKARRACATLARLGWSAEMVVEAITGQYEWVRTGLGLGTLERAAVEVAKKNLQEELIRFFPANMSSNMISPRK